MKVLSVNVGKPQLHEWRGLRVKTAIFKSPVEGPVAVRKLDLAGDEQADLTVHGGADKAVYAYPYEHYTYWQSQLPGYSLHTRQLRREPHRFRADRGRHPHRR